MHDSPKENLILLDGVKQPKRESFYEASANLVLDDWERKRMTANG